MNCSHTGHWLPEYLSLLLKGMRNRTTIAAISVLFFLSAPLANAILVSPLGPQQRVNTTTAGNQNTGRVTMAADGSYVVVWEGPGGDIGGNDLDIIAQRFDGHEALRIGPFSDDAIP